MIISTPIPDAWIKKLDAYCASKELTRAELVRKCIAHVLKEPMPLKKKPGRNPNLYKGIHHEN